MMDKCTYEHPHMALYRLLTPAGREFVCLSHLGEVVEREIRVKGVAVVSDTSQQKKCEFGHWKEG